MASMWAGHGSMSTTSRPALVRSAARQLALVPVPRPAIFLSMSLSNAGGRTPLTVCSRHASGGEGQGAVNSAISSIVNGRRRPAAASLRLEVVLLDELRHFFNVLRQETGEICRGIRQRSIAEILEAFSRLRHADRLHRRGDAKTPRGSRLCYAD